MNKRCVFQAAVIVLILVLVLTATVVADNGLVAYWNFDEGSGGILHDQSKNGNDGTIHGATWVDGRFGKALRFDGVDDYVKVPDSPSLDLTDEITIEAWVNIKEVSASKTTGLVFKDFEYWLRQDPVNEGSKFSFFLWDKRDYEPRVSSTFIPSKNTWYHVVGVWVGSIQSIYINGQLENSVSHSFTPSPTTHDLLIGTRGFNTASYFNGIIDEVRIYNRALSESEIQNRYTEKPLTSTPVPPTAPTAPATPTPVPTATPRRPPLHIIIPLILLVVLVIVFVSRKRGGGKKPPVGGDEPPSEPKAESDISMGGEVGSLVSDLLAKDNNVYVDDINELIAEAEEKQDGNILMNARRLIEERHRLVDRRMELMAEFEDLSKTLQTMSMKLGKGEIDAESYRRATEELDIRKVEIQDELGEIDYKLYKEEYEKPVF